MPNIKSAKKRVLVTAKKKVTNNDYRASMRTAIKKCEALIHDKNVDEAKTAFTTAVKKIDKACSKGVIKKNTAARYKSNLAKKINELK